MDILKSVLASIFIVFIMTGCDELGDSLNTGLSDEEIVEGLKKALEVGTDSSSARLSAVGGYFKDEAVKILLPDEVETALTNFKAASFDLGLTTVSGLTIYESGYSPLGIASLKDKEEELIKGINEAAEAAAKTAGPIFKDAIINMSFTDAKNILYGSDTAATAYLKNNTYSSLFSEYEPKIDEALSSVKIGNLSVVDTYEDYVKSYNDLVNTSIPDPNNILQTTTLGAIANLNAVGATDLSAYSTGKGLDGLFLKVSEEEEDIREDPFGYALDILEKVFGNL